MVTRGRGPGSFDLAESVHRSCSRRTLTAGAASDRTLLSPTSERVGTLSAGHFWLKSGKMSLPPASTCRVQLKAFTFGDCTIKIICRADASADEGRPDGSWNDGIDSIGSEQCELLQRYVPDSSPKAKGVSETLKSAMQRLEAEGTIATDTVGWDVWEGATDMLCNHLVRNPEIVRGKR